MKEQAASGVINSKADDIAKAQIASLKQSLAEAEAKVQNYEGSHNIIQSFIDNGEMELDGGGQVKISKRRPGRPKSPMRGGN